MILKWALILSVVLQFAAFIITISLIPKTRFSIAWISISIGFLLMAFRRLNEVIYIFSTAEPDKNFNVSSWIAVVISVTMLIASIYIRKIFEVLNRIQKLRKENETRLLSTVISIEEKERRYFAKEIHDGLGPVLSSAKMTLSAIDKMSIDQLNGELIEKTENLVDNAIVAAKEISNHLTPQVLERYGLQKAINTFIRNTIAKNTIEIAINTNIDKKRYNHNLEVIIYRISCELINNTLKYASANKITILLLEENDFMVFKYDDNGKGFDIGKSEIKGMGLTNIKSRVKSLNGSIEMYSKPKNGFYTNIKFPL
jgi:signal transduction histidine kinase